MLEETPFLSGAIDRPETGYTNIVHLMSMFVYARKNRDDTAILLFSNHGNDTGDYGFVEKTENTFEDCLTRVPFLVKPASGTPIIPRVPACLCNTAPVGDPSYTVAACLGT